MFLESHVAYKLRNVYKSIIRIKTVKSRKFVNEFLTYVLIIS